MKGGIECYNNGIMVVLKKEDFKICYFCDRNIIPYEFICKNDIESIKILQNMFGYVPVKEAGKIGNKIICKACLSDMCELINYGNTGE